MLLRSALVIILHFSLFTCYAQTWTFVKEKDGIFLYTRKEKGDVLKSFRGVMDIRSTVEQVAALIRDVHDNDWWDENLGEVKVLSDKDPVHFQYYLVYDLSWPLADRDLVVDARATLDPATQKYVINSRSLEGAVPEKDDIIRIKDYWQRWTVQPAEKGMVQVTVEGFADPAGSIPSWLYNAVITNTPFNILQGVRERCER